MDLKIAYYLFFVDVTADFKTGQVKLLYMKYELVSTLITQYDLQRTNASKVKEQTTYRTQTELPHNKRGAKEQNRLSSCLF